MSALAARPALYALLTVMILFWSGNYIVGKIALRSFPPLLLGGLRTAVAGVLILPIYMWRVGSYPLDMDFLYPVTVREEVLG